MKTFQYFLITVVFFIIQSAPFNIIPGLGHKPDIILVLVIHMALANGRNLGLVFGAGVGLFGDLLLCGTVGQGVLSLGLIGFSAGALRESYVSGETRVRWALVAIATLSDIMVRAAMLRMAFGAGIGDAAMEAAAAQMAINMGVAALVMPLLMWVDKAVSSLEAKKEKRRRTRSFLAGMGAIE